MNMDSSRSHSLLTLHLESESIDPDDGHMMVSIQCDAGAQCSYVIESHLFISSFLF